MSWIDYNGRVFWWAFASLTFLRGLTTYSTCERSCHCVYMRSSLQTLSHTVRLTGLLIFCICLWLYVQWPPVIAMIHNFWKIHFVICSILQYFCCDVHLKEILWSKKKREIVLTPNGYKSHMFNCWTNSRQTQTFIKHFGNYYYLYLLMIWP